MSEIPSPTILCVDDNADNRISTSLVLEHAGFRVTQARTGEEGLSAAGEADLVVLDVELPDINGFDVCRRIKSRATSFVPVVMVSGIYVQGDDRAEGLEGGADAYLVKPVQPRELLSQVRALLRVREAEARASASAREADEERRRLRTLTDRAPVLLAEIDAQQRVVFANRPYAARFGKTPEEVIGKTVEEVLGSRAYRAIADRIALALSGQRVEFEVEIPYVGMPPQFIHGAYEPEFDDAGNVVGFIAAMRNMTELRRLQEEYRQSQKMEAIGQLAGGLAHDFNNLMTIVNGFAELVLDQLPAHDAQRALIQEILRAGQRAATLTQQLLAFSRKQILQAKVVRPDELVAEMERELRRQLGSRIELTIHAETSASVLVDPGQLRQVIRILASHAADAMPEGGRFTITIRGVEIDESRRTPEMAPGRYVALSFSDTGAGLSDGAKSRVFEPFFTTKPNFDPVSGLALSAAYGVVKQSDGHITVDSDPGKGSTFTIFLPERR